MKTSLKKWLSSTLALVMTASAAVYAAPVTVAADVPDDYVTVDELTASNSTEAPAKDAVVPDANQYQYQKEEIAAFCHFGMNTFTNEEWGNGAESVSSFTLSDTIDADAYVKALQDAGFEKLIITAKHHDGFCIFASDYTTHDTAATSYPGGDVLADISAACTKYDMDMGLYLSPWDVNADSYGYYREDGTAIQEDTAEARAEDAKDYNAYYNKQLIEILGNDKYGNHGHFVEVWMDGAKGASSDDLGHAEEQIYDFELWFSTIQYYEGDKTQIGVKNDLIEAFEAREDGAEYPAVTEGYTEMAQYVDAPCMLFGAEAYTTVRWIGNEAGLAAEQTWAKSVANKEENTIDNRFVEADGYSYGYVNGNQWTVPEADARINAGWFWHAGEDPKTLEALANMYFNSVGHNSVLLLNVPLNQQGTLDSDYFTRVEEFGAAISESFDENLAASATVAATAVRGNDTAYSPANVIDGDDDTYWTVADGVTSGTLYVDLGSSKAFDVVSIEEAIQFGQRITSFKVEYSTDGSEWKVFDEGTTVGSKRLSRRTPVNAQYLKITVATNDRDGIYTSTDTNALTVTAGVPMISEIGVWKASEAFQLADAAPDGMTVLDDRDAAFTYSDGWNQENDNDTNTFTIDGTGLWCNSGASFTLTFTGSKIYLIGTEDPGHGTATVTITDEQGNTVSEQTIDTQSTTRALGATIYESGDLTHGTYTLTLEAIGKIGIDGAYVINNNGVGMVGIEQSSYTMNEDSEMEVKLVRAGGTTDKDVTVTLSPNPGSAIQKHFDTGLKPTVTFAAGETEKTATVKTLRDEDVTGDLYFTIELTSETEGMILGFNDSAKVTITDTEDGKYTTAYPFVFPSTVGETKRLEAELAYKLINDDDNQQYPLEIGTADWTDSEILNSLDDSGDAAYYAFEAPYAGTYNVSLNYNSGSSVNSVNWSTLDADVDGYEGAKITSGNSEQVPEGQNRATFTMTVARAGAGVLVLTPGANKAPQMDYFDITLQELASHTVTVTTGENGTVTVDGTAVSDTYEVATNESKEFVFTPNNGYAVEDVKINGISQGKISSYTVTNPTEDISIEVSFSLDLFVFPTAVGEEKTLEGESAYKLVNVDVDGNSEFPLKIKDAEWASEGKFLNNLNDSGDAAYYAFSAPLTGTYNVTLTYRSGDSRNGIEWSTLNADQEGYTGAKITAGNQTAGASDNAENTHTVTFTMVVETAGEGVLVLEPGANKAPQIDYMTFEIEALPVNVTELESTIVIAESTVASPAYTETSKNELRVVLNEAKALVEVVANGYATAEEQDAKQAEVDNMVKALNEKIESLIQTRGTYIVDFGLPLEIDFTEAIGSGNTIEEAKSTNGAEITIKDKKIVYTMTAPMQGADQVLITDNANNTVGLEIYPANSVYYEESFMRLDTNWEPKKSEGVEPEYKVVFPSVVDESVTLEAEDATELQDETGNHTGQWSLQVTESTWASGGKYLNCLNANPSVIDKALYAYNAPVAGTYTVTVTYRSGDPNNTLAWSEVDGKIENGRVSAGANDSAGANHTEEFTMNVVTAGAGTLVLYGPNTNAPQLDKFDIVLKEATTTTEDTSILQQTAKPGDAAGYNYGYDEVYKTLDNTEAVTTTANAKGSFTFTGTGIDIYANCDAGTGIAMILIRNDEGQLKKLITVDTALNAGTIDTGAGLGSAYTETLNVPIVSISDGELDYDTYTVNIVHVSKRQTAEDGTQTTVPTKLRLDGFRVYGTLKNDAVSEGFYSQDNESNVSYYAVRDSVVAALEVAANNSANIVTNLPGTGVAIMQKAEDGSDTTITYTGNDLADFINNGSKNELYLYPGQCLVFTLNEGVVNPQIALKTLNDAPVYCKVTEGSNASKPVITVNTEMYYPLTMNTDGTATSFTITNAGTTGVLSITKLKAGASASTAAVFADITEEGIRTALLSLGFEEEPGSGAEVTPTPEVTPTVKPDETPFSFDDVQDEKAYYFDSVYWAYEKGITKGITETIFAPEDDVIRADMVTFLWRAAGSPEPENTVCTFEDVDPNGYYYEAMLWAVEKGITQGYDDKEFGTTDICTRAQMVTFLWRMKEQEAPKAKECSFTDVDAADYYYEAVLWAVENGITTGINAETFAPNDNCTRGQAVTFLNRACR